MNRTRKICLFVLAVMTPVIANGIVTGTAAANTVDSSVTVLITNSGYSPATESINVGDSIGFTNTDSVTHTVVIAMPGSSSLIGCTPNPVVLVPGESGICYFETAGTYTFSDPNYPGYNGSVLATACCVAPSFTSGASATFVSGVSSSFTVETSGVPHATISESGALPSGLVFTAQTQGMATISGTASVPGSYPIELSAANQAGPVATQSFDLTVSGNGAPMFSSPATVVFTLDEASVFTVQAAASPTPSITESGALPAGLTFTEGMNGEATISGSVTGLVGNYTVTLSAANGDGAVATQSLVITVAGSGYLLAANSGRVYAYGTPASTPSSVNARKHPLVAVATDAVAGYYLVTATGSVYNKAGAPFYGSTASKHLSSPISAFATTPDGKGYWLVAKNGTVYPYGDAQSFSSLSVNPTLRPIVAIGSSSDGNGYYLVSARGNVYSFGDAIFYGSEATVRLARPIVGFSTSADGMGYWLVARNGSVYPFGDAQFFGSKAAARLRYQVVNLTRTADGNGYWLTTSGGNVFSYGNATFYGSPLSKLRSASIVGLTVTG